MQGGCLHPVNIDHTTRSNMQRTSVYYHLESCYYIFQGFSYNKYNSNYVDGKQVNTLVEHWMLMLLLLLDDLHTTVLRTVFTQCIFLSLNWSGAVVGTRGNSLVESFYCGIFTISQKKVDEHLSHYGLPRPTLPTPEENAPKVRVCSAVPRKQQTRAERQEDGAKDKTISRALDD